MNVLSLFDGISCGRVALDRAGIEVNNYYASEIDKYAIQVSTNNYPDIIRLGDIQNWKEWNIDWTSIDLILAGSPCQGFSFAGKQLAFDDPRSKLFFVFVEILNHVKSLNPNVKFLLENVRMKKEYIQVINDCLDVEPILINSALVSAQNRQRLYWANWNIEQPEDKGILLKDIIQDNHLNDFICGQGWHDWWNKNKEFQEQKSYSQVCNEKDKAITLTARMYASWNGNFVSTGLVRVGTALDIKGHDYNKRIYSSEGKSPTLVTSSGGNHEPKIALNEVLYRKLTPIECERLQTLPDNYTQGISNSQRYKCLGNGWTVDVIAHILKSINEIKYIPAQIDWIEEVRA